MIHWRESLFRLKNEIRLAKAKGLSTISITSLEAAISEIEDDIQIDNDLEILERLNKTPKSVGYDSYSASLDKYAEYVKTENDLYRQYTQILISSGYAAFFGIWAIVNNLVNVIYIRYARWIDISLVFITISVISFIVLEVAKVAIYGYDLHLKNTALLKAKAEDDIQAKIDSMVIPQNFNTYKEILINRGWEISYPVSVIFGIGALFLMLYVLLISVL